MSICIICDEEYSSNFIRCPKCFKKEYKKESLKLHNEIKNYKRELLKTLREPIIHSGNKRLKNK
jgi:hypothetical protein